jgi:hypothetical protein
MMRTLSRSRVHAPMALTVIAVNSIATSVPITIDSRAEIENVRRTLSQPAFPKESLCQQRWRNP